MRAHGDVDNEVSAVCETLSASRFAGRA